jgi:hypothetical protein
VSDHQTYITNNTPTKPAMNIQGFSLWKKITAPKSITKAAIEPKNGQIDGFSM